MSRKSISIQVPQKKTPDQPSVADDWVSRMGTAAPQKFDSEKGELHISISAEPNLLDAFKLGLFVPSAVFWWWSFAAARKTLETFGRKD
jgi:hypothetical protein